MVRIKPFNGLLSIRRAFQKDYTTVNIVQCRVHFIAVLVWIVIKRLETQCFLNLLFSKIRNYLILKFGQVVCDDIPDNRIIDLKISVNDVISHTSLHLPRCLRVIDFEFICQEIRGFAYHLNVLDDCAVHHIIIDKIGVRLSFRVPFDPSYCFKNMQVLDLMIQRFVLFYGQQVSMLIRMASFRDVS